LEQNLNIGSGTYEMTIDWDGPHYMCVASSGVSEMFGVPIGWYRVNEDRIEPCDMSEFR